MEHEFFLRPPPRSAWRLDFGADFADQVLANFQLSAEDLLATLTEFSAVSIAESIGDHVPG